MQEDDTQLVAAGQVARHLCLSKRAAHDYASPTLLQAPRAALWHRGCVWGGVEGEKRARMSVGLLNHLCSAHLRW